MIVYIVINKTITQQGIDKTNIVGFYKLYKDLSIINGKLIGLT